MLLSPTRATLLVLLAPFAATSPVPLSPRDANGSLVLWDPSPAPLYHSTSSYNCYKKTWYAAGAVYPLAVDAVRLPLAADPAEQEVLASVGNYTKPSEHTLTIEWEPVDFGDQFFALRLVDAEGRVTYSQELYTAPGNEYEEGGGSGRVVCNSRRLVRFLDFFMGLLLALVGVIILGACLGCMEGCVSAVKEDIKKRKEEKVALRAISTEVHPPPDCDNSPRASQDAYLPCHSKKAAGDAASIASSFTLT